MTLSNIIRFRKRDHIEEELAAALELVEMQERTLIDRAASATDAVLDQARGEVIRLDAEIADRQERRRQALVIISAFEPAQKQIVDGIDPPEPRKGKKPVAVAAE